MKFPKWLIVLAIPLVLLAVFLAWYIHDVRTPRHKTTVSPNKGASSAQKTEDKSTAGKEQVAPKVPESSKSEITADKSVDELVNNLNGFEPTSKRKPDIPRKNPPIGGEKVYQEALDVLRRYRANFDKIKTLKCKLTVEVEPGDSKIQWNSGTMYLYMEGDTRLRVEDEKGKCIAVVNEIGQKVFDPTKQMNYGGYIYTLRLGSSSEELVLDVLARNVKEIRHTVENGKKMTVLSVLSDYGRGEIANWEYYFDDETGLQIKETRVDDFYREKYGGPCGNTITYEKFGDIWYPVKRTYVSAHTGKGWETKLTWSDLTINEPFTSRSMFWTEQR
jgi:hypothetical protein